MKLKVLLISLVLSLPIWLGVNALAKNMEAFWFEQELIKRPELFARDINERVEERKLEQLKSEKELKGRLQKLDINARAVISIKVDKDGREKILLARSYQDRLSIASITKLMTALVVFDMEGTYKLSELIPISKQAIAQEGQSRLVVGEELSVRNLLYSMLIESSNDAAFALTQPIGEEAFVELMNLYAQDMGLENTYFINPTGLEPDDPEEVKNYSTVEDLVKLTKYILKEYPEIFEITTNKSYKIRRPDGSLHHLISAGTNKLLGEVPTIIGGKTGWSPAAGGCLILILDDPNSSNYYINIVLGAKDRFTEMKKIINAIEL